jgi:hypothetical protein
MPELSTGIRIKSVTRLSGRIRGCEQSRARGSVRFAAMSVAVMAWLWRARAELRGTSLIVALALADWANDDGRNIFPRIDVVAAKARISVRETRRVISKLERDGVLVRENSGAGRGNFAMWRVNLALAENRTKMPSLPSRKSGQIARENRPTSVTKRGQIASKSSAVFIDPPIEPSEIRGDDDFHRGNVGAGRKSQTRGRGGEAGSNGATAVRKGARRVCSCTSCAKNDPPRCNYAGEQFPQGQVVDRGGLIPMHEIVDELVPERDG